jgi:hypothetical protein
MRQPPTPRQSAIPRKRPNLPRTRRHIANTPKRRHDNQDTRHNARAGLTLRNVVEHLDKRLPRRRSQDVLDVTDQHAEGAQHDEAQGAVDERGREHDARESQGRVVYFFGHVGGGVGADEGEDGAEDADEGG